MAAIVTPTNLYVLETSSLKHPPTTADPTCPVPPLPSSIAWSAETSAIFIASETSSIMQYDLTAGTLQDTPITEQGSDPAISLLTKDRGNTVVYARGQKILHASTQTGRIAHTFDTHKASVTSLSLSNDSSLLASTSARAIHVHNLTLVSHTVLRGIPAGSGSVTTCAFHPHSRTRLLVGHGSQLLVYDTTRPSGPAKTIPLDKDQKNLGPIVAITCSPFSKTLVAVACSGGAVGLVDLEKEKGLFRMVQMPAPLTCLSFSAEGAALYAGTENGKFLVLDLRALDKPPKSVTVSENGDQVIAISVQKKLKPGEAQAAKSGAATAAKPLVQRDTNKAAPAARRAALTAGTDAKKAGEDKPATKAKPALTSTTPRRAMTRTASIGQSNGSPVGRVLSGTRRTGPPAVKSPAAARSEAQKKAFSPPKAPVQIADDKDNEDEGDLSVQVENLLALPKAKEPAVSAEEPPVSAVSRAPSVLSRASSRAQRVENTKARTHTRTGSTASRVSVADSVSAALPRTRPASSASAAGRASKASTRTVSGSSSRSASPPLVQPQRRRVSGSSAISRLSRTPSPDLPEMEDDGGPITPIPGYKVKGKGRAALGLGTPEVDEWVKAGEGKPKAKDDDPRKEGKRVGFASGDDSDSDAEEAPRANANNTSDEDDSESEHDAPLRPSANRFQQDNLAMQVSPRRSFAGPSPARARASTSWAPVPSPLRNPAAPPSPQARAAQDMLQALLRDALHDFRQETKQEIVGLHLDLIRMGGSWRREMREAMGEFAQEMRELREENRMLREENERLRRGY
ncbi:WD40 repeat-like protein [Lentinus tigrinus ALCF2SS1-7]|uniref:WD40 repeat-like protein n=1 Tax=Lentinus tigrinus ALCF2SS1-6 TaxID=1328759 RepID=A0A5C2SSY5_9APHY|nr:WD40 repeat-like protein [Lentinus tigrinus ALCF2SS1-6]RPD80364.1 WD40 repeat-like protein [Lentinus tigrinus ALCF2SS1-7]